MIWLIGNKGMLGSDVENKLKKTSMPYSATDKEIDITNINILEYFTKNKDISWIINCSAYTQVDKAEKEPNLAFKINDHGVLNIAKIANKKKAKLIHLSTDYVFDGEKEGSYNEEDSPNPIGIYGQSKLQGEKNIIDNIENYFIIRISWLFGKNGGNFVYTMLSLFKEKGKISIVSDQYGSPTYTKDVANLIAIIILNNSNDFGLYHFSNEGKISWYNFAEVIFKLSNELKILNKNVNIVPITTKEYKTLAKRPKNSCFSKEKIKKTFNIQVPKWEESLKRFLKEII